MDVKSLVPLIVQWSMILIVFSAGLQAKWRDLVMVLERPALLLKSIIAVNIVTPAVALAAILILPIDPNVKIGIMAMAVSPLAPFAPGKMLKAGAGSVYAVGLYAILIALAVLVVPLTMALLAAFIPRAIQVPVADVAALVLQSILLPLAAGLVISALARRFALRLASICALVGNIALLPVFAGLLYMAGGQMLALLGDGSLAAILAAVLAGLAAGHWLGGPRLEHRNALAIAAALRHPGIAGLIVHRTFADPRAMLAVILFLLVGFGASTIYLAAMRRRREASEKTAGASPAGPERQGQTSPKGGVFTD